MLIGYVSDEMYFAIPGALLEFIRDDESYQVHSSASGAVHAEIPPGEYEVILQCRGYGAKRLRMNVQPGVPYQFRLLSDQLYGYAWPKWVQPGAVANVCVHSGEPYFLELWRYGWEKECVRRCGYFEDHPKSANRQVIPDGDFTQTGVRWNDFGYSFSRKARQTAIAPDRSGLYYFHVRALSGEFFSFPWIVAPARPTASVAVLASNINWNAYNDFGGRSNYIAAVHLPSKPTVNPHQEKVWFRSTGGDYWFAENYDPLSFDRPEFINHVDENDRITDAMTRRGTEQVAPAEWRLLGWLEREGFAYDLYAETQLRSGVLDLDKYKVLILSTHPEYWTRDMYFRVKSWVFERGGKLLYLGGNGINCEVELPDERTMIVRNGDVSEAVANRAFRGKERDFPAVSDFELRKNLTCWVW